MSNGTSWLRLTAVAALAATTLAACAPPQDLAEEAPAAGGDAATDAAAPEGTDGAAAPDGEPVRIGVLAPTTGNLAAAGGDLVKGWELYWEQNGLEHGGRTVEYFVEDTAGDPSVALTKVDVLVDEREVEAVVGPILANVALAVSDALVREGIPSISQSSADDITQRQYDPLVSRPGSATGSQTTHPAGEWAYEQGYRRVVTLCPDYAFGHENCGGFSTTFTAAGGEIVEQLWSPLGTQDFSTYVTQIQEADPDMVFVAATGGDAARFVQTWSEFGLKDEIPFLGNSTILEQSVLRSLGDEALGLQSFGYYAEGRQEGTTPEFVSAFEEAHGEIPSVYAASGYAAAEWVATALEETGGETADGALAEAIADVTVETPLGPMELDDYNNPVENVYLRVVEEREDGTLWNVPVETIAEVSQFWTFEPEEYLDRPVYSRDFQG